MYIVIEYIFYTLGTMQGAHTINYPYRVTMTIRIFEIFWNYFGTSATILLFGRISY